MIKRINITDDLKELAKTWSSFTGNKYSIRSDVEKMIPSNLAEIVFQRTYPEAIRISDTDYNADFTIKDKRVDVKCKVRTVFCEDWYEVNIEARQMNYNVDWYAFYSYNIKESVLEFLGWISKEDFNKKSFLCKKGEIRDGNKWTVSVDCYNLKISELIR